MSWIRMFVLYSTVLLILEFGNCQNLNSPGLRETYVGPIEKSIRLLMKSKRILDVGFTNIKENVEEVASSISLFRHRNMKRKETVSDTLNPFKSKIKAIFPGTYWCGDGDISPNKKDLGLFKTTDACCKAHDSCPDGIPAQEERNGLINSGIFTRSPCECDEAFYHCLKEANTILASDIGITYFNVLRPQCFKEDYPITGCKKYTKRRLTDDKCEEYNYNRTQPQRVQWFDNPDFM